MLSLLKKLVLGVTTERFFSLSLCKKFLFPQIVVLGFFYCMQSQKFPTSLCHDRQSNSHQWVAPRKWPEFWMLYQLSFCTSARLRWHRDLERNREERKLTKGKISNPQPTSKWYSFRKIRTLYPATSLCKINKLLIWAMCTSSPRENVILAKVTEYCFQLFPFNSKTPSIVSSQGCQTSFWWHLPRTLSRLLFSSAGFLLDLQWYCIKNDFCPSYQPRQHSQGFWNLCVVTVNIFFNP